MSYLALAAMATGTGIEMAGTLKEGKIAEKIAKQRAGIDIATAEATRRASVEEARIQAERGRRLLATQKGIAAAAGVRLDVGAPLVIEAQTRADMARDIGFVLERGREESAFYRSRAALERARGKAAKRKSRWSAISQGLKGFETIAMMDQQVKGIEKISSTRWAGMNTAPGFGRTLTPGGTLYA